MRGVRRIISENPFGTFSEFFLPSATFCIPRSSRTLFSHRVRTALANTFSHICGTSAQRLYGSPGFFVVITLHTRARARVRVNAGNLFPPRAHVRRSWNIYVPEYRDRVLWSSNCTRDNLRVPIAAPSLPPPPSPAKLWRLRSLRNFTLSRDNGTAIITPRQT